MADRRYLHGRRPDCKPCFGRLGHLNRRRGRALPESKVCGACGQTRSSAEFGLDRRNTDGLRNNCLACSGTRTYEQLRDRQLRFHYGMTHAEYGMRLEAQGGVCASCGSLPPAEGRKKHLAVDHCHDSGTVRGLLCNNCNIALGLLGDDVEKILALAAYLKKAGS